MSLASKGWVDRRIREGQTPQHGRRLETVSGSNFPWSKVAFGYKINPDGDNQAEVGIYCGLVNDNTVSGVAMLEISKFVISATQTIYIKLTNGTTTWVYEKKDGLSSGSTYDGSTYTYRALYTFEETSGVAVLQIIWNYGNQIMGEGNLYLGASPLTVITAVRMNAGTLEYKSRDLSLLNGAVTLIGSESDWT